MQQRHVPRIDLLPRGVEPEPLGPSNFGDLDQPARPGRPLELEGVALDPGRVEVDRKRPGAHPPAGRCAGSPTYQLLRVVTARPSPSAISIAPPAPVIASSRPDERPSQWRAVPDAIAHAPSDSSAIAMQIAPSSASWIVTCPWER